MKTNNRYIPNFKKANWSAINFELKRTNWDRVLKYCEPEIAWRRFKHISTELCNTHIPKVTVKSDFQPSWFDSDVHNIRHVKTKIRLEQNTFVQSNLSIFRILMTVKNSKN